MRPRLPAASALVAAGLIVLLVALLYGRFGRPLGLALALAGLALLAAGYAAYLGKRGAGPRPGRRFWRGRPLDQATRAPWWRRWGRRR